MDKLIENFPGQLREAIEIGERIAPANRSNLKNVVISGLGGSGIGGKIASQLIATELSLPVTTNNDYHLPHFVDANTLVIISTYSGNTEETLNAFEDALAKNAQIFVITSGGKAMELAKEKQLPHVVIPGGFPPRAALAYSLVQLLFIFASYRLISKQFLKDLQSAIDIVEGEKNEIHQLAKTIATTLNGKTPVLYAGPGYEGVAVRWRQQLNENAKVLCWHHVLPEMNHNELVGWAGGSQELAVIFLQNEDDYERTTSRFQLSKSIIQRYTDTFVNVKGMGASKIQRSLYLIHLGDWVSFYLSQLRGVDAMEVNAIDFLKSELAQIK